MENLKKQDFAFTLQIPAGCNFGIAGSTRYRELYRHEQERMLHDTISVGLTSLFDRNIVYNIIFESHKDQRRHAHGTIQDVTSLEMSSLQRLINCQFGYAINNLKIFHYKVEFYEAGWSKYKQKEQKDMLFNIPLPLDNNINEIE